MLLISSLLFTMYKSNFEILCNLLLVFSYNFTFHYYVSVFKIIFLFIYLFIYAEDLVEFTFSINQRRFLQLTSPKMFDGISLS